MGEYLGFGVVEEVGVDPGAFGEEVFVCGVPVRVAPEDHHFRPRCPRRELGEERPLVEPGNALRGEENLAFY